MSLQFRPLIYKAFSYLGSFEVAELEKACWHARGAQEAKLLQILSANGDTEFGRKHNFKSIKSAKDFRSAVPINTYESFSNDIDRMLAGEQNVLTAERPFMFATTSGTTGKQKFIPVTPGYIKEFRHASVASGYYTLQKYPKISQGVSLSVFSPAQEGLSAGGLPYGAISGALYLREPALIKKVVSPIPYEAYITKDYESRYYCILRAALCLPVAVFYTLNPSTITMLYRKLVQHADALIRDIAEGTLSTPVAPSTQLVQAMAPYMRPDRQRARELSHLLETGQFVPHKIWPQLQVVCCWTKAAAAFYLQDFPTMFGCVPVCDISYGASEGRGTVSLGDGRQLLSLRSHFFEFVPEDEIESPSPTIMLADELEVGQKYYILFTTSAGLYRYNINDVILVTGKVGSAPLIEFQYKGGNVSSFTGEKITELQVTQAMSALVNEGKVRCRFFTLIPQFRPQPHYRLLLELEPDTGATEDMLKRINDIAADFDIKLGQMNIEYQAKRESGRLSPVAARLVQPGSYERFRLELTAAGAADAQIKVSHLAPKEDTRKFFEERVIVAATALPG